MKRLYIPNKLPEHSSAQLDAGKQATLDYILGQYGEGSLEHLATIAGWESISDPSKVSAVLTEKQQEIMDILLGRDFTKHEYLGDKEQECLVASEQWEDGIEFGAQQTVVATTLQKNSQLDPNLVLDVGCGLLMGWSPQKGGIEKYSSNVCYFDIQSDNLENLRQQLPPNTTERSFVLGSKDNLETIEDKTVQTILRFKVGATNANEVSALKRVLTSEGDILVANRYGRQPMEEVMDYIEKEFGFVDIYLGIERYLLHCRLQPEAVGNY